MCIEDYSSHLPTPDMQSQAPPGRFRCTAAFCMTACATRCVALAMPTCRTEGRDARSAGRTDWSSFETDGGLFGAPSWPLALRCLVARPGRAVTGRPYVCMLRDAWYLLEVRAPQTDSLRIARRVLHEALVGRGVRPSVFCRLCV